MEHTHASTHSLVRRSYWWALPITLALLGTLLVWNEVLFIDLLLPFKRFGLAGLEQTATVCKWGCLVGLIVVLPWRMGRHVYRNRNRVILASIVWALAMVVLVGGFSFVHEPIAEALNNGVDRFYPISPDSPEWYRWSDTIPTTDQWLDWISNDAVLARWQTGQVFLAEVGVLTLIGVGLMLIAYVFGRRRVTRTIVSAIYASIVLIAGALLLNLVIWDYDAFYVGTVVGPLAVDVFFWPSVANLDSNIGFPTYAFMMLVAAGLDVFWMHADVCGARGEVADVEGLARPTAPQLPQRSAPLWRRGSAARSRSVRPRRWRLAAGALGALVLVAGLWGMLARVGAPPTIAPVLGTPMGIHVPPPASAITPANANQLANLATWRKGSVNQLAYTPNGRALVVGASRSVYLYDARTLAVLWKIDSGARSVAVAPDGAMLALATYDDRIELRQVADGGLLRTIDQRAFSITKLAFAPDGATLAGIREAYAVQLWRVSDGQLLHTLKYSPDIVEEVPVAGIAFAPDGDVLAVASRNMIRVWLVATGYLYTTFQTDQFGVGGMAFTHDGQAIAVGAQDGTVKLWRSRDGKFVRDIDRTKGPIYSMAFAPDNTTLAFGLADRSVLLFDQSNSRTQKLQVTDNPDLTSVLYSQTRIFIPSLAFAPDGSTLAAAWVGGVQLWRMADRMPIGRLGGYQGWIKAIAFSPNGAVVATGDYNGTVQLWRAGDGTPLYTLLGHTDAVESLTFSPDGRILASSGFWATNLWRVADGTFLSALERGSSPQIAFSPDSTMVAIPRSDSIEIRRVADGNLVRKLAGAEFGSVDEISYSPDGATLTAASRNGLVQSWSVDGGPPRRVLLSGADEAWHEAFSFSPDGATLALGMQDGSVKLWRVADGIFLRRLPGRFNAVSSLAFSPDDALLAVAAEDNSVSLWRVADGVSLAVLGTSGEEKRDFASIALDRGYIDPYFLPKMSAVAFSSDGTLIAVGSQDDAVRLWGNPSLHTRSLVGEFALRR